MTNPFDDETAVFHVLTNASGHYSLWPEFVQIPAGWSVQLASASRPDAIAFVEESWTGLHPSELAAGLRTDAE